MSVAVFLFLISSYGGGELFLALTGRSLDDTVKVRFCTNLLGDLQPDVHVVDRLIPGLPYHVTTDGQGFRDLAEIARKKKGGTVRILCLGDSYTYGVGVDDHLTYPALLETLLQRKYPGTAFEVVNAGVPFFDIIDELDYYRDKGRLLGADAVVLQFFANDLESMTRYFFRPHNKVKFGEVYHPVESRLHVKAIGEEVDKLSGALLGPSFFRVLPDTPRAAPAADPYASYLIEASPRQLEILNTRSEILSESTVPEVRAYWDNYARALTALRHEVERDGAAFLFIMTPDIRQIESYQNGPSQALVPFLKQNGVPFIDFVHLMRRHARESRTKAYLTPANEHLSAVGNTLVAWTVAEALNLSGAPDGPRVTFTPWEPAFDYRDPVPILFSFTPGAVLAMRQNPLARLTAVHHEDVKVVQEGPAGSRLDSLWGTAPAGKAGRVEFTVEAAKPLRYFTLISFHQINHPSYGFIRLSYSLDGLNYKVIGSYMTDPADHSESMERMDAFESPLPRGAKQLFFRIELAGDARLFMEDKAEPLRRFELVLYPEAENADGQN